MRRLATLLLLCLALGSGIASGVTRPADRPPVPGLAFAVAMKGNGDLLAAGPFLLKVPGAKGALRLELSGLEADGASLRGQARLRNDSGLLLAGLTLDFESATETGAKPSEQGASTSVPVALKEPLSFGDLLGGEKTPFVPFELSPIPLGEEVFLTTLLGSVRGLAAEPAVAVAGAVSPVALDADRSGRLYLATGGVGRVLRFTATSPSSPFEAARPSAPPAGIALRPRNGDLFVSTGSPVIEVHRPGLARPATLDAGRPVTALRIDGKNVLRAASGNAVLAFDEARPGPARTVGPGGSRILSFDADGRGVIHAVVAVGGARRVFFAGEEGPLPFPAKRGAGSDAVDAPSACRFDGEGLLWIGAESRTPEGTVLARFLPDGTPLAALSREALALLLGKEEGAGVPPIVDLARGPEGRLYVLLEDGSVFVVRAF
ncbi:MAG: hypothetical protein IPP07_11625 [Holophagales bacterium]|nr:hypothetical protein [Holophagales bacterium]